MPSCGDETMKKGPDCLSPLVDKSLEWNRQQSLTFALFFIFGMGANWVTASALFQQVPYLEMVAPEGLCISAYINASVNAAIVFVYVYVKYGGQELVPNSYMIPAILICGSMGCFFAAAFYSVQMYGMSFFLLIGGLLGGITGGLTSVVITPFLMRYRRNLISATRGGGSFAVLLCGLVAHYQHPDRTPPAFSTSI